MTVFNQTSSPGYSEFIQLSRYARWREDLGRRETWAEVVDRWQGFWTKQLDGEYASDLASLAGGIYNLEVMPSMRTLMTAGPALERDHVAGYNCAYRAIGTGVKTLEFTHPEVPEEVFKIPLKDIRAFDEILYILMCGTGAGFSVERQFINLLPTVGKPLARQVYKRINKNYSGVDKEELSYYKHATNTVYVADSKYGWASALRCFLVELYNGNFDVKHDTTTVRSEGAILHTFGGRASGPEPLIRLFEFARQLFKEASGRKLTSIECHDLVCMIADIVVVGGVRRAALISLSNLTDARMAAAKTGDWRAQAGWRENSNNSTCYTETPDVSIFMGEWKNIHDSYSGERGIFNREAAQKWAAKFGRRNPNQSFGCNPCSEIVLPDQSFCNLTEIVIRADDDLDTLKRKAKSAAIIGTMQATLTEFKYLNPQWQKNCEEEALLGVSMTGIMDHRVLSGMARGDELTGWGDLPSVLEELKDVVLETNDEWAQKLGISRAAAATCVKPSGTVSQLVDAASGIHARHNPHYLRTVRGDKKDPMARLMVDQGFPYEQHNRVKSDWIFSFPMKAPEGAVCRDDRTAIEQLELWLTYQRHWCEHKPSITVNIKEHEWMEVGAWVYERFDEVSGVAFLPHDGGQYEQAPYQDLTAAEYNFWVDKMPETFDWTKLGEYEVEDRTKAMQTYACVGGVCEVVDLSSEEGSE